MSSMFWGLRLEPGKRYTATVDKPFHVSMAALDCTSISNDEIQTVMLEEESDIPFILCNLQMNKVLQARLDLNFVSGNRVTFFCRGNGSVHLTGYVLPEDEDCSFEEEFEEEEEEGEDDDDEEEDEDEEMEVEVEEKDRKGPLKKLEKKKSKLNGLVAKRKSESSIGIPDSKKAKSSPPKKDIEAEDDSDEDVEPEEEEIADFDEEEEEEEQELESEPEEVKEEKISPVQEKKSRKKKKNKQNQASPPQQGKQKQQSSTNGSPQEVIQQKKKAKLDSVNEKSSPTKSLDGGVVIKDLKIGTGQVCKPGKVITVYYTGRLKSNNKVFDQTQGGQGFKFRLGRGEVIKGWDIGLVGMKVGGKRKITIPSSAGYGQDGSPPTIPPNSALVFDVEIRAVN